MNRDSFRLGGIRRLLGALCVTCVCFGAFPTGVLAADAAIGKAEWAAYLRNDMALKRADSRLNAAYKAAMKRLSSAERKTLLAEQKIWIDERNAAAFAAHEKGSAAYTAMLAKATEARAETLGAYAPAPPEGNASPGAQAIQPPQIPQPAQSSPDIDLRTAPQVNRPQRVPAGSSAASAPSTTPAPEKNARQVPPPVFSRPSAVLPLTTAEFAATYNGYARPFGAAFFPVVPETITEEGTSRSERYALSSSMTFVFDYSGTFERPAVITFYNSAFLRGSQREKDASATALAVTLKTLTSRGGKTEPGQDGDVLGLINSIDSALVKNRPVTWENSSETYIVYYDKRIDTLMVTIRPGRRGAALSR